MASASSKDGPDCFAHGFMHCCRSGKTLIALKALWGYDGELRPHQAKALEKFPEVLRGPRRKCMMVFSTLPVLQQFLASTLTAAIEEDLVPGAGSVVMVCSASEDTQGDWCRKEVEQSKIECLLKTKERVLLLTTYASVYKIDRALKATSTSLDLAVFDEAHNVHTPQRWFLWGGNKKEDTDEKDDDSDSEEDATMQEGVRKGDFLCTEAGVLDLERHYPRRIYLTATPNKRMQKDDRLVRRVYGDPCREWDVFKFSHLLKAQREYSKPCVKEFELRILVNGKPKDCQESAEFYDKVCVLREIAEAQVKISTKMSRVLMYHALASVKSGVRAAENYGDVKEWQRALSYVKRMSKGRYTKLTFKDFKIYAVKGGDADVQEKLAEFNAKTNDGKVHILCSCRVFGEGVTLERCDMTVFADGKRSPKDIVQSGLRGIKYDQKKPEDRLRILLLTNLDGQAFREKTDPVKISEEIINALRSRCKMEPLALVLAVLQEEDEEFAEEVMAMLPNNFRRTKDGRVKEAKKDSKIGMEFALAAYDKASLASGTQLESSSRNKEEAEKRRRQPTNSSKSRFSIHLAKELFSWRVGDDMLTRISERCASSTTIELIGGYVSMAWEKKYAELLVYKEEHGHCEVPWGYKPNPSLHHWVCANRMKYKRGTLSLDHTERLERVGFVWDRSQNYWEKTFQELLAYRQEHGHCKVPQNKKPNNSLATWVNRMRRDHKTGKMAADHKQRLDSIDFDWSPREDWDDKFVQLIAYRQKYGNFEVPQAYKPNRTLRPWLTGLRLDYKMNRLDAVLKQRLESIGFVWDCSENSWEQKFQELLAYKQEHNHCNVPKKYERNPSLSTWVWNIRARAARLSAKRKARLEDVGFVLDPTAHRQKRGNCHMSQACKSNHKDTLQKNTQRRGDRETTKRLRFKRNAPIRTKDEPKPRKIVASPPSLEDASQAFRKAQANAEVEEDQPAKKRRKTVKSYDASSFSVAHINFKNNVLAMLLAGCPGRKGLRAAFLDDFAEDGVTLRTTQQLLETGRFAPRDLYCANPNHKVVEALRRVGVNANPGVFVEAAQAWAREDSDLKFDLAYVDLCTGSADEVQKNLEAVLPSMAEVSVLAYTITGRSGSDKVPDGEHDHTWHMMGSRMQRILRSVEKDPHSFELIGTLPGKKLGEVKEASEIFFSDGARGARVCTVLFKRGPGRVEMLV